jgi:2-dehydro-3-deoxyphosphogluconate aldolase/(4S)-4-hydroxy-2-oxoglutarate aldolase
MADIFSRIGRYGIVPVIAIDDAAGALDLADALIAGDLPVAEITFRTQAGQAAIKAIAKHRPQILLGAGTILSVDQLRWAAGAGASFGVAPGLNPAVAAEAVKLGFPFTPGVMTPGEVESAMSLGLKTLKLFPAEVAGGVKMLKALAGPYGHTGVKFVPTGGIDASNFQTYLALDCVLAVGGSWMAQREAIAKGDWAGITAKCREARKLMAR